MKIKILIFSLLFFFCSFQSAYANWGWGALAIERNNGSGYGWAVDYSSYGDAQERALEECGSRCYIVKTFQRCAAFAKSANGSVFGWGNSSNSEFEAKNEAIEQCKKSGGSNCSIKVWGCNSNSH